MCIYTHIDRYTDRQKDRQIDRDRNICYCQKPILIFNLAFREQGNCQDKQILRNIHR